MKSLKQKWSAVMLAIASAVLIAGFGHVGLANACSSTPDPSQGTDTQSINVSNAGTYTVWSRMLAPDSTNNSYYLQIDGGCAITVGGSSNIPNSLTWVNYQNGSTSTPITVNLTAGSHQVVLTGNKPGVGVSQLLFLSDASCVPTGSGSNCTPAPDTTQPTVSVSAPAAGTTVTGTTKLSATATDNVKVASVQFYVDGTAVGSPITTPDSGTGSTYSYIWDSTAVSNASHAITAKAVDTSSNAKTSTAVSVTVSNSSNTQDTTPPTVGVTAPTANAGVSGNVNLTATATDNVKVETVQFQVDGKNVDSAISNNGATGAGANNSYAYTWNSATLANGTHKVTATASDGTNTATSSATTISVNNQTGSNGPTSVQNLSFNATTKTLSWTAFNGASSYTIAEVHNPTTTRNTNYSWPHVTGATCVPGGSCNVPAPASGESVNFSVSPLDSAGKPVQVGTDSSGSPIYAQWAKEITVTWPTTTQTDTAPPSQPTNLKAQAVSSSQINLSWTASTDNVGVTGYKVYRSLGGGSNTASQVATVTTASDGDTGLQASTAYSYYVIAVDAAGNKSTQSSTVSATTQSATSTTASLSGVVRDSSTSKLLQGVQIVSGPYATANGSTSSTTNSQGYYLLSGLDTKSKHHYHFSLSAYKSQTFYLLLQAGANTQNVNLVHQ